MIKDTAVSAITAAIKEWIFFCFVILVSQTVVWWFVVLSVVLLEVTIIKELSVYVILHVVKWGIRKNKCIKNTLTYVVLRSITNLNVFQFLNAETCLQHLSLNYM